MAENKKRFGIIIGGSGLIGGTMVHYFTRKVEGFEILAPNSKKLSLRDPEDIKAYFRRIRPDFIINSAMAAIDSDPLLTFETNYLGGVNLARVAASLDIPYIYISSAAVLPDGENLREEDRQELDPGLSNYAKSKIMAEMTLEYLQRTEGLDFTIIRLGVVYGEHDHKIQGFHRMLFSIADQSMPVMLTRPGVLHSYSNARKLPFLIHHILDNREEFSGETYHFVDPNPVDLSQLIITIRNYLELKSPREIYIPYSLARFGASALKVLVRLLIRIGVYSRMPPELMFLKNCYKSQVLSRDKLKNSSFNDPDPNASVFTALPRLIQYYITRWEQLNLITPFNKEFFDPKKRAEIFLNEPDKLIESVRNGDMDLFLNPSELQQDPES